VYGQAAGTMTSPPRNERIPLRVTLFEDKYIPCYDILAIKKKKKKNDLVLILFRQALKTLQDKHLFPNEALRHVSDIFAFQELIQHRWKSLFNLILVIMMTMLSTALIDPTFRSAYHVIEMCNIDKSCQQVDKKKQGRDHINHYNFIVYQCNLV
jgi:hypothetical protein